MKNLFGKLGFAFVLYFSLVLFSSCSDAPVVSSTRVLREVPQTEKKNFAKTIEKREKIFFASDIENIEERYRLLALDNDFIGKTPSRSLRSTALYKEIDSGIYEPVRSAEFKNVDKTYSNYVVDPTQKSVMGVSYNTRDGYLRSAKASGYPKGYLESLDSSSGTPSGAVLDSGVDVYHDQLPKGYLESLGTQNAKVYSGNGYLEQTVNSAKSTLPKGYLESIGEEKANAGLPTGYMENTFISDFDEDGVLNEPESQLSPTNSYLDMTLNSSLPTGYLQNVQAMPQSKGYIETYNVVGDRPYVTSVGF